MARLTILAAALMCAVAVLAVSVSGSEMAATLKLWEMNPRPKCQGLIGDCLEDDDEMMLDNEINKRILAARRNYISYGALRANSVPCSRRGASYYNCKSGSQANPYRRGCSRITRCARDTS